MPCSRELFRCRRADPNDIFVVCDMLNLMHAESVPGDVNWDKVVPRVEEIVLNNLCYVMEYDGEVCGTMAIEVYQPWWSDEFKCTDEWIFIDEDHRCLHAFRALLDYVVARTTTIYGMPIRINLNTRDDGDRKRKLFSNYMHEVMAAYECKYVGGTFLSVVK